MNLFRQRRYGSLPPGLQRDVKTFFGGLAPARAEAQALLFAMAEPGALEAACERAAFAGVEHLKEGVLLLRGDRVQDLPPILRGFAGCAGWLHGDPADAHVVELKPGRRRVVLSRYADFETSLAPELEERAKIDLRQQTVRIFAPPPDEPAPVLLAKGRLLSTEDPGLAEHEAFDLSVHAAGLHTMPSRGITTRTLEQNGLTQGR